MGWPEVAGVKAVDGAAPDADCWVIAAMLDAPAIHESAIAEAGEVPVRYPDILRSVIITPATAPSR